MWANAASGLPHLQHVTFGVASRGFKGFQGSLLYTCSVISWSLQIKRFAIANHCGFLLGFLLFFPSFVARKHSATIWRPGQHVTAKRRLLMPWFLLLKATSPVRRRTLVCLVQAQRTHLQRPNHRCRTSLLLPFWPRCKCCQASASGRANFESAFNASH